MGIKKRNGGIWVNESKFAPWRNRETTSGHDRYNHPSIINIIFQSRSHHTRVINYLLRSANVGNEPINACRRITIQQRVSGWHPPWWSFRKMAEFEFVVVSREFCFHFRSVAAELIIERERGRESLPIIPLAGVILSRLRWPSINFRKHVSMHVHFFFLLFNYWDNCARKYIYILGSLLSWFSSSFWGSSSLIYIKDWFEFLGPIGVIANNYAVSYVALLPLFAFAEIN